MKLCRRVCRRPAKPRCGVAGGSCLRCAAEEGELLQSLAGQRGWREGKPCLPRISVAEPQAEKVRVVAGAEDVELALGGHAGLRGMGTLTLACLSTLAVGGK